MNQWFVQQSEDVMGPLSPADLLGLVRQGVVTTETKVRKGDSAWFTAGEVGGLFEAAVKPTIQYLCPGCGAKTPPPPCHCDQCGRDLQAARRQVIENRIAGQGHQADGAIRRSMLGWLDKVKRRPE